MSLIIVESNKSAGNDKVSIEEIPIRLMSYYVVLIEMSLELSWGICDYFLKQYFDYYKLLRHLNKKFKSEVFLLS